MRCLRIMSRLSAALAIVLVVALSACGGSGRTASPTPSTPAALATLDVVRTGGIAANTVELHLRPGDARLRAAQDALGVPLPASTATRSATADAFVYVVTATLSDGTTAMYSYDQGDVPGDLQKLDTWLGTAL
jgi:cellulase/cellobiase CelA1